MERPRNLHEELAERCGTDFVQNGTKLIIACSKCGAQLVELWRTKPYAKVINKVTAQCGLCGDKSFPQKVCGGFHIGDVEGGKVTVTDTIPGTTTTDEKDNIVIELTVITEKL